LATPYITKTAVTNILKSLVNFTFFKLGTHTNSFGDPVKPQAPDLAVAQP